jgi:hypothetical protein
VKLFGRELEGRAKTLVILVAVLLVSAGLCGLQWNTAGGVGDSLLILIPLGFAELAAMFISACWIVILLIAWGAEALYHRYGKPHKDEVQKLFEDGEDEERNDPR